MAQEVRIEGLAELETALKELPKATSRNVLLRVLKKEAQPIADAGNRFAPTRVEERPRGEVPLSQSYIVSTGLTKRQRGLHPKTSMVEVYVGPSLPPGQWSKTIQTEFGNSHQAPHPHMRPAWDENVQRVLNSIRNDLADEIEKARKRIAAKAERLAAKMGG